MKSLVEIQWQAGRRAMELSSELGWNSILHDSTELFEAKLELRNASSELKEAIEKYRNAERKYKEAVNADLAQRLRDTGLSEEQIETII